MPVKVYVDGSPTKIAIIIDGQKYMFQNKGTGPLEIEYMAFMKALELLSGDIEYIVYSDNQSLVARMNCDHALPSSRFDEMHSRVIDLITEKNIICHVKWFQGKGILRVNYFDHYTFILVRAERENYNHDIHSPTIFEI